MNAVIRTLVMGAFLAPLLGGCASWLFGEPEQVVFDSDEDRFAVAGRLTESVQRCWFGEEAATFQQLMLGTNINPYANMARITLFDTRRGVSALIIDINPSQSGGSRVIAAGPLLDSRYDSKIERDLERWIRYNQSCDPSL